MDPITGLAYGRVAIGTLSLVSPKLAARLFLLDPKTNPQLSYMGRLFASREIALGVVTLAAPENARRRLVQLGVGVDAADALTGITAVISGSVPKKTALLLTVAGVASTTTGVLALQES
jgi:hypothetical protein